MNLGIGSGVLIGGLIATTSNPSSFTLLFVGDAATFLVFAAVIRLVPHAGGDRRAAGEAGGFAALLRHRVFVGALLLNLVLVTAGIAQFDIWPGYMKNQAGLDERAVSLVIAGNTALIVLSQLPVARLLEGRRRMRAMLGVGILWGGVWLCVPAVAATTDGTPTLAVFVLVGLVFGIGACLHGAVQGPLVVDLADERLLGRYMAASALSWSIGFAVGPAVGGFLLGISPPLLWIVAGLVCAAAGGAALLLERRLPQVVLRTPRTEEGDTLAA